MSDTSQGPGWWQASDGKWYPPEQHPDATAPMPAAPPAAGSPAGPPLVPPAGPPSGPPTAPIEAQPFPPAGGGRSRVPLFAALGAVAVVAIAAVAFFALRGSGGKSAASFCTDAKKLASDTSLETSSDPAKLDQAVGAFDKLTREAPNEIRQDMQTVDDFVHKLQKAVHDAKSSDQFGAVLGVFATVDQRKLEAAGANIDRFAKEKCGVDLSFSSSSSDSFSFGSGLSDFGFSDFSDFSNLSSLSSQFSDLSSFASDFSDLFSTDFFSTSS